ncbi:MAG: crossover junction endodeoxyribonuclease RuvC [Actinomycetota bacterium]|nr:crossover junction endodeoxyribonuclease RuvC [Actinomycetota bacterium]
MGIDPGTANLGFGVVRIEGGHMVALDGGVIETGSGTPDEQRLNHIHSSIAELLEWHRPSALAIEDLYFGKNTGSAMKVGQASGVCLLAAAQKNIECFAYTPQAIKSAVCGSGNAAKRQVQKMVATLLGLSEVPRPDHAADALAVAICHGGNAGRLDAIESARALAASKAQGTGPVRVAS